MLAEIMISFISAFLQIYIEGERGGGGRERGKEREREGGKEQRQGIKLDTFIAVMSSSVTNQHVM